MGPRTDEAARRCRSLLKAARAGIASSNRKIWRQRAAIQEANARSVDAVIECLLVWEAL